MQQYTNTPTAVDDYLASLDESKQQAAQRVYAIAREIEPDAEQAVYYNMPCLKYRGQGLVAVMATNQGLSLYPFSNLVNVIEPDRLGDFETTTGSIHFSVAHPLPDDLLRTILTARRQWIINRSTR